MNEKKKRDDMPKSTMKAPNMPFVEVPAGSPFQQMHNVIVAELVQALTEKGYGRLNYDHIKLPIPKHDVPLDYEGARADIAIALGPNVMCQIEVNMVKTSQKLPE